MSYIEIKLENHLKSNKSIILLTEVSCYSIYIINYINLVFNFSFFLLKYLLRNNYRKIFL